MPSSQQFGPPPEWPPRARVAAWVSLALLVVEGAALALNWTGGFRLAIGIALLISVAFWIGQLFGQHPSETGDPGDST